MKLRTPLSMIKGYVETLINGAKDDPNVATRFLQTSRETRRRLTYLNEDLLTISARVRPDRHEHPKVELRPLPTAW